MLTSLAPFRYLFPHLDVAFGFTLCVTFLLPLFYLFVTFVLLLFTFCLGKATILYLAAKPGKGAGTGTEAREEGRAGAREEGRAG
jgi:hypothetical protein